MHVHLYWFLDEDIDDDDLINAWLFRVMGTKRTTLCDITRDTDAMFPDDLLRGTQINHEIDPRPINYGQKRCSFSFHPYDYHHSWVRKRHSTEAKFVSGILTVDRVGRQWAFECGLRVGDEIGDGTSCKAYCKWSCVQAHYAFVNLSWIYLQGFIDVFFSCAFPFIIIFKYLSILWIYLKMNLITF